MQVEKRVGVGIDRTVAGTGGARAAWAWGAWGRLLLGALGHEVFSFSHERRELAHVVQCRSVQARELL